MTPPEQRISTSTSEHTELETLRRTNAELLQKCAKRKSQIAELEITTKTLQEHLNQAQASLHDLQVSMPLKAMAQSLCQVPDLFLDQLAKYHRVELVDGVITLLTLDGKPIVGIDGNRIPFERQALADYLTVGDDEKAKRFKAITVVSRASGSTSATRQHLGQGTKSHIHFGLH